MNTWKAKSSSVKLPFRMNKRSGRCKAAAGGRFDATTYRSCHFLMQLPIGLYLPARTLIPLSTRIMGIYGGVRTFDSLFVVFTLKIS